MFDKIKAWFKDSTTILWGRIQTLVGAVLGILMAVDLSPLGNLLPAKWASVWLVVSGIVTEIARRRSMPS
jgi:hypothetical protein